MSKTIKKTILFLLAILAFIFMQFGNSWQSTIICLGIIAICGMTILED